MFYPLFTESTCIIFIAEFSFWIITILTQKICSCETVVRMLVSWTREYNNINLFYAQGVTQGNVLLWREPTMSKVEVGVNVQITHMKMHSSAYGDQLQSTNYSTLEVRSWIITWINCNNKGRRVNCIAKKTNKWSIKSVLAQNQIHT